MREEIKQLADILVSSAKTMALTGAGISVESGIPDFRSPGGLWSKVDPDRVFSRETFLCYPEIFYREGFPHLQSMLGMKPNKAHYVLARMEESNILYGVTTQNVDNLHREAGSSYVLELHGHLRSASCMSCKDNIEWDYLCKLLVDGHMPPRCSKCGGVYKPDAVFFGDNLPRDFETAAREIESSTLLIVAGSSLEVAPVNLLPQLCPRVVIINNAPTELDDKAALVIRGKCGEVFAALEEELEYQGMLIEEHV